MNKFNTALLAIGVALIIAACAPTTDNAEESRIQAPEGITTWNATVSGMPVTYRIVEVVIYNGEPYPGISLAATPVEGVCDFQVIAGWGRVANRGMSAEAQEQQQITSLAFQLGQCLGILRIDLESSGFEGLADYGRAWSKLYLERCGYRAQPLGWPVEDGECEVPAATEPKPSI